MPVMRLAPGIMTWFWLAGMITWALLGGALMAASIRRTVWPARVRHAAPSVLVDVPAEPVIQEGSLVIGQLTHELLEDEHGLAVPPGSQLAADQPGLRVWLRDPVSDFFRRLGELGVPQKQGLRQLAGGHCRGNFGNDGLRRHGAIADLSNDTGQLSPAGRARRFLASAAKYSSNCRKCRIWSSAIWPRSCNGHLWVAQRCVGRALPREMICAVQLCPWKFVLGSSGDQSSAWVVQGLLVLHSPDAAYLRLPIMLTSDFAGAARLMQRLAATLEVPYLFAADAAGWQAEEARAVTRPPLAPAGFPAAERTSARCGRQIAP